MQAVEGIVTQRALSQNLTKSTPQQGVNIDFKNPAEVEMQTKMGSER